MMPNSARSGLSWWNRQERERGARGFDKNPSALDTRAAEIHLLEKIRKAVAEHVAAKEAVEEEHADCTARQHERNKREQRATARNMERVPFEAEKHRFGKMDQLAKSQIAERRQHADDRGEQDHLEIVELVGAQPQLRLGRIDLGSRHAITLREIRVGGSA